MCNNFAWRSFNYHWYAANVVDSVGKKSSSVVIWIKLKVTMRTNFKGNIIFRAFHKLLCSVYMSTGAYLVHISFRQLLRFMTAIYSIDTINFFLFSSFLPNNCRNFQRLWIWNIVNIIVQKFNVAHITVSKFSVFKILSSRF